MKYKLAYYDSMAGILPCKILESNFRKGIHPANSIDTVKIKLTADKGAYKNGEIFDLNTLRVVPRDKVYRSSGFYRIKPYTTKDFIKGE